MTLKTNQVATAQMLECKESGRRLCIAVTHLKACTDWGQVCSAHSCDLFQNLQNIGPKQPRFPLLFVGTSMQRKQSRFYKHAASSSLSLGSAYELLDADGQLGRPYTALPPPPPQIRASGECRHALDTPMFQHTLGVRSELWTRSLKSRPGPTGHHLSTALRPPASSGPHQRSWEPDGLL